MGSFKESSADFIGGKYEGGVKLILESEEDVKIFCDHWFSRYQDKIRFESAEVGESFESAEAGKKGGGGCAAVVRKVKEARGMQLIAFGIVDRDMLLGNGKLNIFWETNDQAFHEAKPYGEEIHVLRRWELENYLLKPEAFSMELACRLSRSPSPNISSNDFLHNEDDFVDITALTTFMVANGMENPKIGFAQTKSGQPLRNEISEHLGNKCSSLKGYSELSADIEKIRAFSEDEQTPEKRWDRLSRILDGKKTLNRICGQLSLKNKIKGLGYWEEMRGCLANRIASAKLIDDELVRLIERFCQEAK
jgi:hypothetical protein